LLVCIYKPFLSLLWGEKWRFLMNLRRCFFFLLKEENQGGRNRGKTEIKEEKEEEEENRRGECECCLEKKNIWMERIIFDCTIWSYLDLLFGIFFSDSLRYQDWGVAPKQYHYKFYHLSYHHLHHHLFHCRYDDDADFQDQPSAV